MFAHHVVAYFYQIRLYYFDLVETFGLNYSHIWSYYVYKTQLAANGETLFDYLHREWNF